MCVRTFSRQSQSGVASGSPGGFAALGRFLFGNRTETGSEDQRKDQEEGQDEVDAGDATEAQSPPQSPKQSEDPVGESSDHGTATEISDALAKGDSSQADNGDATEDAEPATAPSSSADDNPAAVPMASSPEEVTGDETAVEVDETSAGFDAVSMGSEEEDTKAMAIAQPMSPKVDSSTFVVGPPISPRAVDEIGGEPSTSAVPAEADLAPTVDVAVEEDGVTADESHLDSGEDREEGAEVAVAATEGAGSGQEAGLARVLVSSGEEAEKEAGNQEDLDREEDEPLKDDDNGADVSAAGARPVSDRSLAARIGAAGVGRPRSLLSPRGKAGGNIKARPLSGKAVSLLSGERKTGLAALEQQVRSNEIISPCVGLFVFNVGGDLFSTRRCCARPDFQPRALANAEFINSPDSVAGLHIEESFLTVISHSLSLGLCAVWACDGFSVFLMA